MWPSWLTPARRRVLRRAFKVALAATVATAVARLFDLPNPWFATLAAVVAMEITMRVSLANARNTLLGAGIGALAGMGLSAVAKQELWAVGVLVLVCFVVFGFLRMESVGRQAALVGSVIVLVPDTVELPTASFAWVRFAETAIGIGAALAVNRFVFPPHAYLAVRSHLKHCFTQLAIVHRLAVAASRGEPLDAEVLRAARVRMRSELSKIDELWDEAVDEDPPARVLARHWRGTTRRIWEQEAAMVAAAQAVAGSSLLAPADAAVQRLAVETASALDSVAASFGEDGGPVEPFPRLLAARDEVLEVMPVVEASDTAVPVTEALACFAFVNSLTVVSGRLVDMADASGLTDGSAPGDGGGEGGQPERRRASS